MTPLEQRLANEKRVFKKAVESGIRLGYMVSLYDGEEWTVKRSTVKAEILRAGQTTDMDKLSFRHVRSGELVGFVLFIYGNLGSEVINDWSDNAETNEILADALAYMESFPNAVNNVLHGVASVVMMLSRQRNPALAN